MKKIQFFVLFFLLTAVHIFGQHIHDEKELVAILAKQDSIPRAVFLDKKILPNMSLVGSNTRQVWTVNTTGTEAIEQLFDVRLKFDSEREALAFHKKHRKLNSENGVRISSRSVKVGGAKALKVYKGSHFINNTLAESNFDVYCFLFVVDKYFVKMYITCKKSEKPESFKNLIGYVVGKIKGRK